MFIYTIPTLLYSPTIKTFPHTRIYIVENSNKKCGKLLKFSTFTLLQCEKLLILLTTFPQVFHIRLRLKLSLRICNFIIPHLIPIRIIHNLYTSISIMYK